MLDHCEDLSGTFDGIRSHSAWQHRQGGEQCCSSCDAGAHRSVAEELVAAVDTVVVEAVAAGIVVVELAAVDTVVVETAVELDAIGIAVVETVVVELVAVVDIVAG